MKAWQWAAIGLGAVVLIVVIMKSQQPKQPSGSLNTAITQGASLGGFFSALFSGGGKVSAPGNNQPSAGSGGYTAADYNGLSPSQYGSQYSAAMGATSGVASANAGSGGTNFGGGLSSSQASDPLGIGTLTAPNFDIGTGGVDFANN